MNHGLLQIPIGSCDYSNVRIHLSDTGIGTIRSILQYPQ